MYSKAEAMQVLRNWMVQDYYSDDRETCCRCGESKIETLIICSDCCNDKQFTEAYRKNGSDIFFYTIPSETLLIGES